MKGYMALTSWKKYIFKTLHINSLQSSDIQSWNSELASVNNICLRYNGVFLGKQDPEQVGFKARKMDFAAMD